MLCDPLKFYAPSADSACSRPPGLSTRQRGFGIFMMLGVLAIFGLVAGMMTPVLREMLDAASLRDEQTQLDEISVQIQRSWTNEPVSNLAAAGTGLGAVQSGTINAANAAGVLNTGGTAALFTGLWAPGQGTTGVDQPVWPAASVISGSFEQKLVLAASGLNITGTALNRDSGDAGRWLFNSRGFKRIFIRGPIDETGLQRWLVVSVMAPVGNLAIRDFPPLSFDQLWNFSTSASQLMPGTGSLVTAWNDQVLGRTLASRVLVKRITQQKHTLALSNLSTDRYLHVQVWDRPATYAEGTYAEQGNIVLVPGEAIAGQAGSGSLITFLHGTRIVVQSGSLDAGARTNTSWVTGMAGLTAGPFTLTQFHIQDNSTLLLNPAGLN